MYNKTIVVGHLGKNPEMRYTPSGQAVTSFSVAVSRQYTTGNGEQVKETTWFRASAWGKTAENCNKYLKKGSKVLVEGRLVPDKATGGPRIWTRQDGSSGASFELSAAVVVFLSPRGDGTEAEHHMEEEGMFSGEFEGTQQQPPEDDIPF